jgi:membrane protein implicated in regulation of membrane protease activity
MSPDLLLRYEAWMIAGLTLVVLDLLLGLDFFALSAGLGALGTGAVLLTARMLPLPLADSWPAVLALFALLSLAVLIPLRHWLNRRRADGGVDINDL